MSRKGTVRAGKEFTLFISNEDVGDVIRIVKSLEDSEVLIDGVTETVKHAIKNNWISCCFVSTFGCLSVIICDFFSSKRYY